jgi:spermidine synthase
MTTLFQTKSKFQNIALESNGRDYALLLDGYFQFHSRTERVYHEYLTLLPLLLAARARRVLILGGGDGLAVREALKWPSTRVTLVELDPAVLQVANREPVASLNEASLSDGRVNVVAADAKKVVPKLEDGSFDVICMDFPAATSPELEELYSPGFVSKVMDKLAPGGVIVSQVSEGPDQTRRMRRMFADRLGHGMEIFTSADRMDRETFAYGSSQPFAPRRDLFGRYVTPAIVSQIVDDYRRGKRIFVVQADTDLGSTRLLGEYGEVSDVSGLAMIGVVGFGLYYLLKGRR